MPASNNFKDSFDGIVTRHTVWEQKNPAFASEWGIQSYQQAHDPNRVEGVVASFQGCVEVDTVRATGIQMKPDMIIAKIDDNQVYRFITKKIIRMAAPLSTVIELHDVRRAAGLRAHTVGHEYAAS